MGVIAENRRNIEDVQNRLEALVHQLNNIASRQQQHEDWIDVVSSPLPKRVLFWLQGFRWKTLGRWRGKDKSRWPQRST